VQGAASRLRVALGPFQAGIDLHEENAEPIRADAVL
jgi:hypothetical protein